MFVGLRDPTNGGQVRLGQRRRPTRSGFVLEGQLKLHTVEFNLSVLELHVLLHNFGDAQVAQRLRRALNVRLGGIRPARRR